MIDQYNQEAIARHHLDRLFRESRLDSIEHRPAKGWIRAIRDALGLTARQLAARMGKTHSTVVRLEQSEARDAITLASLREAAAAMGCTLVYALVPTRPLDQIVRDRAEASADELLRRVHQTMRLEDQALGRARLFEERERLINAILAKGGARLWEDA